MSLEVTNDEKIVGYSIQYSRRRCVAYKGRIFSSKYPQSLLYFIGLSDRGRLSPNHMISAYFLTRKSSQVYSLRCKGHASAEVFYWHNDIDDGISLHTRNFIPEVQNICVITNGFDAFLGCFHRHSGRRLDRTAGLILRFLGVAEARYSTLLLNPTIHEQHHLIHITKSKRLSLPLAGM